MPVMLQSDCMRLLGLTGNIHTHKGINVDRQCEKIGVCTAWPGESKKNLLTTPWAVPATDVATKYYKMPALTFADGVAPIVTDFAARRLGQTYEGISALQKPGAIRDAGVVVLNADSSVDATIWASFLEGVVTYCVAAIVQGGKGGFLYAAGRDCCTPETGFTCGSNPDKPSSVKSGLVMGDEVSKYAQAKEKLNMLKGKDFINGDPHPLPIYLYMTDTFAADRASPPLGYTFVVELKQTTCSAPIWKVGETPTREVNFWAGGTDCCSLKDGFHCGPVESPTAHSGEVLKDFSGDLRLATMMAVEKYGIKMAMKPVYVKWTEGSIIPKPAGR
jgi:hypothetical protein